MATLAKMIKNPVYKGQFVAHRFEHVMVERPSEYGFPPKKTPREVERPEDEWIIVPVPPIVSPELWQLANDVLKKNKQMEQANAKHEYLLVGVLK